MSPEVAGRPATPPRPRASARIAATVDALPIHPGMRVLEIGCGPGVAAREIVHRWRDVFVLGVDRSPAAVRSALAGAARERAQGRLDFRVAAAETFVLQPGDEPFDLAFAVRVGAFDGRHPELYERAVARVSAALEPGAPFFIDGGDPLLRVDLAAAAGVR